MALKSNTQNFFQKFCWELDKKFDCEVEEKQMVRYTWFSLAVSSLVKKYFDGIFAKKSWGKIFEITTLCVHDCFYGKISVKSKTLIFKEAL